MRNGDRVVVLQAKGVNREERGTAVSDVNGGGWFNVKLDGSEQQVSVRNSPGKTFVLESSQVQAVTPPRPAVKVTSKSPPSPVPIASWMSQPVSVEKEVIREVIREVHYMPAPAPDTPAPTPKSEICCCVVS